MDLSQPVQIESIKDLKDLIQTSDKLGKPTGKQSQPAKQLHRYRLFHCSCFPATTQPSDCTNGEARNPTLIGNQTLSLNFIAPFAEA